jgi:hypothetical protein
LGFFSGTANNWRKAKAATIIQTELERYQNVSGINVAPEQSSTRFVNQTWDCHAEAFSGKVVAVKGPLSGKRQGKPRTEVLACMAMAEVIDATRHEMGDSPTFYVFLYAFRGVIDRCWKEITTLVKEGSVEEAMLGFMAETYHEAVAIPDVKMQHPRLLMPLGTPI